MTTEPPPNPAPAARRRMGAWVWLVGIGVYTLAIWWIGWPRVRDVLQEAHFGPLFVALALIFGGIWVRALKWRLALGPKAHALPIYFLSKFAGEWSPGRVGELSPLLIKRYRSPRVGAWIVVDRLLETGITLGLGLAGLALIRVPNQELMLGGGVVVALMLALALFLVSRAAFFRGLASRRAPGSRLGRLCNILAEVAEEVREFRGGIPVATALTLATGAMDIWVGGFVIAGFGSAVPFALLAVGKVLHVLTCAIPFTPNATGAPYVTTAILLHEVGGVPSDVLAAVIGVSVVMNNAAFYLSMLPGTWLATRTRD